jgi:hypothetical protein
VGNRVERHWFIKWWDKFNIAPIIEDVRRMAQALKAQNVPLPFTISPKLIGNTPNKALTTNASPASFSTSMSKKERKKALLKAMIELQNEEDSEEEDSTSSAPIYNPQRFFLEILVLVLMMMFQD